MVRVYVNLNELVGEDTPDFGFGGIRLKRPLMLGESITATQTVQNNTSAHSIQPVVVSDYPPVQPELPKPIVGKDIFECGRIVPVGELMQSVIVHVFEEGNEIGTTPTPDTWCPVFTTPLDANKMVTAIQTAGECVPGDELKSPESDPVSVKPAPNPVPSPAVDPQSLVVGNDAVVLTNLCCGAEVTVLDNGTAVGGGYATGSANWCPISSPLLANSKISAVQDLCVASLPSDEVEPKGQLRAPVVVGPICEGARFVIIRETTVNANVVLFRGGQIIGYGGAMPGDLVIGIGGNAHLAAGNVITARQTMGKVMSPVSNAVTVVARLEVPSIEITGGEPFFLAEATDQAIDGPVFPRGRGLGPLIKIQACCTKEVSITILDSGGNIVTKLQPVEIFPGYYTARWNWLSDQGWAVPSGIPIGAYTVEVKTSCDQRVGLAKFYITFNPDDVNGPSRFSFNKTAIWFGTGTDSARALLYYLHPNDARVFGMAISAVVGITDPRKAAETLSHTVSGHFAYSLNYHTNDVVDLLEHYNEAQCADEACCLTALLRAIGIPAHPVTADASLETGAASWTFDTWTEFLAPTGNGTEWLILHPHEYPNDPASSRQVFGTKGVATNSYDDLIIMANENWVWNEAADYTTDVGYTRNACQQPNQQLSAKPWVDHICEQGYWAQPHWDCTGRASHALHISHGLRLERPPLRFGDELAAIVALENLGEVRTTERIVVELVSHRLEAKGFPGETFDTVSHRLTFEPGRGNDVTIPFRLQLPRNLAPGYELYIHIRIGERTLHLQPIRLLSVVESELRMPSNLHVGEDFAVLSVVRNVGDEVVNGISLTLNVPYAIHVHRSRWLQASRVRPREERIFERGGLVARIESLPPGGEQVIEWTARAMASLEAGMVRLEVRSENGGPSLSVVPVRVLGPIHPLIVVQSVISRKE
jgi:hypothetical protein